jgi:hypothetical protein
MKKKLIRSFTLLFFLQVTIPPVSADQLGLQSPDIEPPKIFFDERNGVLEEGIQTFSVTATDNIGIASVTLYYKGVNDVAFIPRIMKQSTSDSTLYTTEVSIDSVISNKLDVYIRADDVAGNSIFKGQKFSPFTFTIMPRATSEKVADTVTEPPVEEEGMSTITMILIGVGVLALAGGGGGGSSSGDNTGSITITSPLPGE